MSISRLARSIPASPTLATQRRSAYPERAKQSSIWASAGESQSPHHRHHSAQPPSLPARMSVPPRRHAARQKSHHSLHRRKHNRVVAPQNVSSRLAPSSPCSTSSTRSLQPAGRSHRTGALLGQLPESSRWSTAS